MSVPNTFVATTTAKSAEVNDNFTSVTDGSALTNITNFIKFANTYGVQFKNAAGTADAKIYEDVSNILKFTISGGSFSYGSADGLSVSKITLTNIGGNSVLSSGTGGGDHWFNISGNMQVAGYITGGTLCEFTSQTFVYSTSFVRASTYTQTPYLNLNVYNNSHPTGAEGNYHFWTNGSGLYREYLYTGGSWRIVSEFH